jgi:hypothetical protein
MVVVFVPTVLTELAVVTVAARLLQNTFLADGRYISSVSLQLSSVVATACAAGCTTGQLPALCCCADSAVCVRHTCATDMLLMRMHDPIKYALRH